MSQTDCAILGVRHEAFPLVELHFTVHFVSADSRGHMGMPSRFFRKDLERQLLGKKTIS